MIKGYCKVTLFDKSKQVYINLKGESELSKDNKLIKAIIEFEGIKIDFDRFKNLLDNKYQIVKMITGISKQ
jgi:hypothetical protein